MRICAEKNDADFFQKQKKGMMLTSDTMTQPLNVFERTAAHSKELCGGAY